MGFQTLFKFVKCWRAPDVVTRQGDCSKQLRWVTAGNGSVPYGLLKQAVGRGRSVAPYAGLCVGR